MPLLAQIGEYAGPAVLSRGGGGVTPAAPISFRPYLNVSAVYSDGMGATLSNGVLKKTDIAGGEAAFGVYGFRGWKRTILGVNYRGSCRQYNRDVSYDGTNQLLVIGLSHQVNRKVAISVREGAGTFTQNVGSLGTFGFYDPTFAQIPHDELLDSRASYMTTMADVTYTRTPRLSFNVGGTQFLVRRRISSFYGVTGASARGDLAYRWTRRSTIAVDYFFTHYSYTKAFGSADTHSAAVDYSYSPSRMWEIGVRMGMLHLETQRTAVVENTDPIIIELFGRRAYRVAARVETNPTYAAQVSRHFRLATLSARYDHGVSPGNGVYLASSQSTASLWYTYNGVRRWSLTAQSHYSDMNGIGQDIGNYRNGSAGVGAARSIGSNVFFTARYDLRRYLSGETFRRTASYVSVGFAYSPGDVPLRLW